MLLKRMASQELLSDKDARQYDPTNVLAWVLSALHMRRTNNSTGGLPSKDRECSTSRACQGWCNSAPRTAPHIGGGGEVRLGHLAEEKVIVCCDEELETSFTYEIGRAHV